MSKNLNQVIKNKIKTGNKLLSVFVTAGFPERNATSEIILNLAESGVDFVELGIPFSDPIADGPVIQTASQTALQNGFQLRQIFFILEEVRKKSDIPIILMGYLNPIYSFGLFDFFSKASQFGADGFIIPDWPLEESAKKRDLLNDLDLDLIHLIAPNTPNDRILQIDSISTSFLYCVAYTGVTGQQNEQMNHLFFESLKKKINHPFLIGFGVKNRNDFKTYTQFSDGVIIGSEFIRILQKSDLQNRKQMIRMFVKNIIS